MQLPPDVREFLAAPRFAVLATLRPDGLPRQSAMWYDLEGDQILLNTAEGRKKLDDIRRDPRVSLCIVDGYRYVTIIGRAKLIDAPERGQADIARLAVRYHGPEEAKAYIPQYQQQRRVTILVEPEQVYRHGV